MFLRFDCDIFSELKCEGGDIDGMLFLNGSFGGIEMPKFLFALSIAGT